MGVKWGSETRSKCTMDTDKHFPGRGDGLWRFGLLPQGDVSLEY